MKNMHHCTHSPKTPVFLIILLIGALLPVQYASSQQSVETLRRSIEREINLPIFEHTIAGIEISDLSTGKILYERNADLLMRPASNAKLLTSATALLTLPETYQFRTSAYLATRQDGKTELWIQGGGDPLFRSKDIQKFIESIPAHGIQTIHGVYLDASRFDTTHFGEGWMWDDEWSEFSPYLSAFTIDGGVFTLTITGASQPEVRIQPQSQSVQIELRPGNGKTSIWKTPASNHIIIEGAPKRRTTRETISIWRPQDVFLERILTALQDAHLLADDSVSTGFGSVPREATPLATVSRPLDEVLAVMNKESNNLCAELVLKTIAAEGSASHTAASTKEGIDIMERALRSAGVRSGEMSMVDGSGISFYNLVTPAAMGKTLRYMYGQRTFDRYAASLAVAGSDGTLARRLPGVPRNVIIGKTGTIRGVSALSGYVLPKKGRKLAFVLFMQNFSGSHAPYRDVQDRILNVLLSYANK